MNESKLLSCRCEVNDIRCKYCVILYDVMFYCFEILLVYDIVSVILLKVVCKGNGYQRQFWSKSKCEYQPNYIMKHVDVSVNLLHENLDCWYVFMKWNDVYKMSFDTMYVTVIGNKMQNYCKA